MAQTKKRRRRKHRGTQGGSIDRARGPRPRSRAEAKAQARAQMSKKRKSSRSTAPRQVRAPSWRGAINRAAIGAVIFVVMLLLLFRQPAGTSIALSGLMFLIYIPMGHSIDRFFYNRRMARDRRPGSRNGRS